MMTNGTNRICYEYKGPINVGYIPDTHWEPEHRKDSLKVAKALGRFYNDRQPEVIIHAGDANDMGSLSSYDKGKLQIEGKRLKKDLRFSRDCLDAFLGELAYEPDLYITLGNHEDRLHRLYKDDPSLDGIFGDDPWGYAEAGFEVHPYLHVLGINDCYFSHYFQNPSSVMGSPIGGTIDNALKNLGHSFVQGHVQTFKTGQMHRGNGTIHCGTIAGACYIPQHSYKGPQGNRHWKGTLMLENLERGYYDISTIGLRSLLRGYG